MMRVAFGLMSRDSRSTGRWGVAALALSLGMLTGCASGPAAVDRDPVEPLNRGVSHFNDAVDATVLKPVATAYREVLPQPVRAGVGNFFGNLADFWSFTNSVLQFKPQQAADNFFRFGVNSTLGFAGVLDIASEMGIERHPEDFGQTLGRWGVPPGPYLVLPILGSSTLRDAVALELDTSSTLIHGIKSVPARHSAIVLQAVDRRASLLRAGEVLDQAALDKYSFTRDVYLQKRRNDIHDGNPPEEDPPAER
jgi:phospholipid-binding lipoprotein MlaA